MTSTDIVNATVHYLVVDRVGDKRIFVFLDKDPARKGGPTADAVTLQLLPGGRVGSPVDVAARPILGQDPRSQRHYREFRSEADMVRVHFLPVTHYRVCESWEDYQDPWFAGVGEEASAASAVLR